MGTNAGSVSIDLDAKIAKFESDMGRAAKMMERDLARAAKTSQRALADMERQAKQVGAVIGTAIAAGAAAAAYAIKKSINAMDEMSKSAQRAGLPTEQFSKLAYAASLADVSMQDLQGTMGKLVKNQAAALKAGSEQAKVFESLGIAVTDSEGRLRSAGDVFADFADAFQRHEGSPEIMAAGFQVMGKSFQGIIPLIKDGSAGLRAAGIEAEQLGKVLSTKAGQEAERFNDDITRMQGALAGATQQIAIGMLPKLNEMTGEMVAAAKQTRDLQQFGEGLATVMQGIGKGFAFVAGMARQFTIDTLALSEALLGYAEAARNVTTLGMAKGTVAGGMARADNAWATRRGMMQDTARDRANAAAQADIDRMLRNGVQYTGPLLEDGSAKAQAEAAARIEAERKRLAAAYRGAESGGSKGRASAAASAKRDMEKFTREDAEATERAVQAVAAAQERFADLAATLSGPLAQAEREHQKNMAEIDRLAKEGERTTQEKIDLKTLETQRYNEQVAAIEAQLNPARALIAEMKFENSLIRMGNVEREIAIAQRRANVDAMSAEGAQMAALIQARELDTRAAEAQQQVQRHLSDAIYGVISGAKSAKDAFTDFFDAIADMILRAAAENWSKQIASWMGGIGGGNSESQMYAQSISSAGLTGGGGSGGGFWATAMTWLGSFFGGGRADGGPVMSNKLYEVNERGPELLTSGGRTFLMMGQQGGYVTPMDGASRGGGVTVNQTFVNPRMYDRRSESHRAAEAAQKLKDGMRFA